jgi:5-formyltetrahydrofolate cyclo-ligase
VNEETSYEENEYGIAEPVGGEEIHPEDLDAVFVPLLCFDEKGYRVGYGKGFYDRFLSSCREDVIRIGFSYFDPVPSIDDINDFDVPLNLCITPNKLYEF